MEEIAEGTRFVIDGQVFTYIGDGEDAIGTAGRTPPGRRLGLARGVPEGRAPEPGARLITGAPLPAGDTDAGPNRLHRQKHRPLG